METQYISATRQNKLAGFGLALLLGGMLLTPVAQAAVEQTQIAQTTKSLSQSEIIDQATSQSADRHIITKNKDGSVRIPSPMQAVIATLTAKGASIHSGDEAGEDFALLVNGLGRDKGKLTKIKPGKITSDEKIARLIRNNLIEEFSTSAGGIRQDFVISSSPKGKGKLVVELDVIGASVALDDKGAKLTLKSGRELAYHNLLVADASGQTLPAHFAVKDNNILHIIVDDAGAAYPVRIDPTITDSDWFALRLGASAVVNALAWDGNNLYVGGVFISVGNTVYGDVPANRIAKWDTSASVWEPLHMGLNNQVIALAWHNGELYVGGEFTKAIEAGQWDENCQCYDDLTVDHIARWDGTNWHPLEAGVTGGGGSVRALASAGSNLYVGGYFTYAINNLYDAEGNIIGEDYVYEARRIAKWTGSTWESLNLGIGNNGSGVSALAWDGNNLYVGGSFTHANNIELYDVLVNRIALWDGTWHPLQGGGITDNYENVYALTWDGNSLYVGGTFTRVGENYMLANRIAKWTDGVWEPLNLGLNATVHALAWDGINLYVGGSFSHASNTVTNDVTASRIARWDGTWSSLGSGVSIPSSGSGTYALALSGSDLHVGGYFTIAGGKNVSNIAGVNLNLTMPDPLVFTDQSDVALNTQTTSNIETITGLGTSVDISITGGEYSLNGGTFTSAAGTVSNGDTLQLRTTSSVDNFTTTNVVVSVGSGGDTWSVTTLTDTIPDAFHFNDQYNVTPNTLITSNTLVITGLGASSPVSIFNILTGMTSEYSINGGAFTSDAGFINNGDSITVRTILGLTVINIGGSVDYWLVFEESSPYGL